MADDWVCSTLLSITQGVSVQSPLVLQHYASRLLGLVLQARTNHRMLAQVGMVVVAGSVVKLTDGWVDVVRHVLFSCSEFTVLSFSLKTETRGFSQFWERNGILYQVFLVLQRSFRLYLSYLFVLSSPRRSSLNHRKSQIGACW